MPTMTITDPDWTIAEMAAGWADDETLTAEQVRLCADSEVAWLISHTHEYLHGWRFDGGEFSGPASHDALRVVMELTTMAVDFVVEHMDEILAEDDDPQDYIVDQWPDGYVEVDESEYA